MNCRKRRASSVSLNSRLRGAAEFFALSQIFRRLRRHSGQAPYLQPEQDQEPKDEDGRDGEAGAPHLQLTHGGFATFACTHGRLHAVLSSRVELASCESMHKNPRLDLLFVSLAHRRPSIIHEHPGALRASQ
jgi:hypothetical protein